jgi:pimeloyl-ACP methyl ester carboxylesterase
VLVLPGGRVRSDQTYRWWHSPNLRMMLVAGALRRRLGPGVEVRRIQYRLRGWNSPRFDAVADANKVLEQVRLRFESESIVLVGHSMGGRVAARLAASGGIGAVVVHGTADIRTDPVSSRIQTLRARQRGLDAHWVPIAGAGHYLLRRYGEWHRRTVDFVADHFVR